MAELSFSRLVEVSKRGDVDVCDVGWTRHVQRAANKNLAVNLILQSKLPNFRTVPMPEQRPPTCHPPVSPCLHVAVSSSRQRRVIMFATHFSSK